MTRRFGLHVILAASAAAVLNCCASTALSQQGAGATEWWQRGQSNWVYMDGWTGKFVSGGGALKKTFEVDEPVKAAVIQIWSAGRRSVLVNGKEPARDPNRGPVVDYDITKLIVQGTNTIELTGSGEVVAEGGVVLASGKEIVFATGASWATNPGSVKLGTERSRGRGGYYGDYFVGRALGVTTPQKAKLAVNNVNLTRRRLREDWRIEYWRRRDPAEVLARATATDTRRQWAEIGRLLAEARPSTDEATKLIKSGKYAEALKAAQPAVEKAKQAEEIYEKLMASLKTRHDGRRSVLFIFSAAVGSKPIAPAGVHQTFNASKHNRLGWVCSTEPLDNDPLYWEFDIAPPRAKSLHLAGLWRFTIDARDKGAAGGFASPEFPDDGWKFIFAPTKWGWERWGYSRGQYGDRNNKPYNGLAWYRKKLVIPAAWKGSDLLLELGARWSNTDWLAVNGRFINPPTGRGNNSGVFTIPARLIRFGQENVLAMRTRDSGNIGGIINPGLRLSVVGREPENLRSPVGPAVVRKLAFKTDDGPVEQINYSSALSPAVVVATSGKSIRLAGWEARGYVAPDRAAFVNDGKLTVQPLHAGTGIDPKALGENWMLLWASRKADNTPRPLLVVFEKRPAAITWTDHAVDPSGVQLDYAQTGPRVALVRPFDETLSDKPDAAAVERCRLWAAALLRYPVAYAEQLVFSQDKCKVRMDYEYLELADDWNTKPLYVAPLPMLASYATEHNWPAFEAGAELTDLGCRSTGGNYPQADCGTYRVAVGAKSIGYSFDRMEPKRHYKGIGTWSELYGRGEKIFADLHKWGYNSSRPQIGYQSKGRGSFKTVNGQVRYEFTPQFATFHDNLIKWHSDRGMMCFINWFIDTGHGGWTEETEKRATALWEYLANRYKDAPAGAVCYDLINEPAGIPWDVYNPAVKRLTAAIRRIDKVHPISVESGGGWAQPEDLDMTEPTGDANTIYQYHFYGPHKTEFVDNLLYPRYDREEGRWRSYEGWEERMLSPIRFQIRHHAEVYHGEFGISHLQAEGAAEGWLDGVLAIHEKYRMHWNWWHYSGGGTYRTGLVAQDHMNPLAEMLARYARMGPPK